MCISCAACLRRKDHPRQVVHEVGLFQGRLGFDKAIVRLEDGCEEFSNIEGLGQIRFPTGNIAAKFEEVRAVARASRPRRCTRTSRRRDEALTMRRTGWLAVSILPLG